jgi:predicted DNA binding CopG/RHH family protein
MKSTELLTGAKTQISIRLTENLLSEITRKSKEWGINRNQTIERLLAENLGDE